MPYQNKKIGIVLCGGGVRGLSQIGILASLEEHGIVPDYVSGASIGAVIGAFYAAGYSPLEMLEISRQSSLIKVFRLSLSRKGLSNLKYLRRILEKHIKSNTFDALKKKLFISVSNLNTGRYEIFSEGPLFDAVMASSAVPIVFEPQYINGYVYVDGGLLNNFPIEPLKAHCDKTLGVFVHNHYETKTIDSWGSIVDRCLSLQLWHNSKNNIDECDFVIEPEKGYGYGVFKKKTDEELFRIGKEKTDEVIDKIRKKLNS
ncbi:MAG: patatin-like phospholipase family protein [Bacteroidales bacterium]